LTGIDRSTQGNAAIAQEGAAAADAMKPRADDSGAITPAFCAPTMNGAKKPACGDGKRPPAAPAAVVLLPLADGVGLTHARDRVVAVVRDEEFHRAEGVRDEFEGARRAQMNEDIEVDVSGRLGMRIF